MQILYTKKKAMLDQKVTDSVVLITPFLSASLIQRERRMRKTKTN